MQETQDLDLRAVLAVLRRNRGPLALFVATAMISSLAYTYIFSERYRATTTILYRPNSDVRFEGLTPQQQAMGFPIPVTQPFEAFGLTIKQVGTSERILRPVVVELGLDKPEPPSGSGLARLYRDSKEAVKTLGKNAWQVLKYGRMIRENPTSMAIEDLAANTTIDTKQKNYAATLTVVDKDPKRAARIVDRIGSELVKFMKDLSAGAAHDQGIELDKRLAEKEREIADARVAIEKLKLANHFIELAEETSLHLKTAEHFELQLMENNAELSAARAKLDAILAQREKLSPLVKASETISDDPIYTQLREMKASSEVELNGLLERTAKEHPDVRSVQAELRSTQQLLASAEPTRVSQVSMGLNEVYQTVHAQELKVKSEIAGLESSNRAIQRILAQAQARITKPSVEAEHDAQQLHLSVLESDYKKLSTLREEVRAAELTSKAEVRTLHSATPQDKPFRAIKVYHVLASGLLALVLGVGFIYLIDYVNSLFGGDEQRREAVYA